MPETGTPASGTVTRLMLLSPMEKSGNLMWSGKWPRCFLFVVRQAVYELHRSQKNVPSLACYNFDAREWIMIFFGRNVTDKVGNQKTLYYATSNNLCFCTTCQNGETWKSHFWLNWIVLHTQCTCALYSWKKKLSSVMCLIASNICWDSKISHWWRPLTFTSGLMKNNSNLLHSDWHRDKLG